VNHSAGVGFGVSVLAVAHVALHDLFEARIDQESPCEPVERGRKARDRRRRQHPAGA